MSQKPKPNNGPTDTDCAEPAPLNYRLPVLAPSEYLSVDAKCTKCETVTTQEWVTISPLAMFEVTDPFKEVLEKNRRLIVCTVCGTLSLKM